MLSRCGEFEISRHERSHTGVSSHHELHTIILGRTDHWMTLLVSMVISQLRGWTFPAGQRILEAHQLIMQGRNNNDDLIVAAILRIRGR
jgi:hypothetical protein